MNAKRSFDSVRLMRLIIVIWIAISVSSMFLVSRLNGIVHGDLYSYGLQFSFDWAVPYWNFERLIYICIGVPCVLGGFILALDFWKSRRKESFDSGRLMRLVTVIWIVASVASIFQVWMLNGIVHGDLYSYGLHFSLDWAVPYWNFERLIYICIGVPCVLGGFILALDFWKSRSREHMMKIEVGFASIASLILLVVGAATLLLSIVSTSTILALIGLGLTFWGSLLLYIRNPGHTQKDLLDASIQPSLETINQIIQKSTYEGNAIYLPPKYFENPETTKIYIPERKGSKLPTEEEIQKHEKQLLVEDSKGNPKGILLTPPGAELSKLFEKTLETSFTKADLQYLQQNMPKLIVEDLEIAQNLDIETTNNKIHVKLEKPFYPSLTKDTKNPGNHCILGSLFSSAIACALTKATGKPIIIENQHTSNDDKDIEIKYQILEEEKTE